jgi:DNA-binding LacI/PurR family transcriptional regulator
VQPDTGSRSSVRRTPSLHEVAAASGVHYSTVSRVLSPRSDKPVSEETRLKVMAAVSLLGYRPNAIARGLRTARTAALGLTIPTFRNPRWGELARGAYRRAWERGFVLVIVEDQEGSDMAAAHERLVEERWIDALLIASDRRDNAIVDQIMQEIPTCFVGRQHLGSGRNVTLDEHATGRLVATRMAELGHRRVAHVAGPPDNEWLARRSRGFLDGCKGAGISGVMVNAPIDEQGGETATEQLLGDSIRPTGLFVTNFNQTFGALAAIRHAGLAVPRDISIVSSDDDPVLAFLEPPITCVARPMVELGAAAVDAVIEQLETGVHRDILLPDRATLVERGSLGRAPEGQA